MFEKEKQKTCILQTWGRSLLQTACVNGHEQRRARKISRLRSKWRNARSAIKILRRFYNLMRRTTISHSSESFKRNLWNRHPTGYP